ncbi:MAG: PD-(D/E)XK nuclease family protein, partial [Gemmatimonadota bacterium]
GTTISWRSATPSGIPLLPSLMAPAPPHGGTPAGTMDVTAVVDAAVSLPGQRRRDVLRVGRWGRAGDRGEVRVVDVLAAGQAIVAAFVEELRAGSLDGVAGIEAVLGLEPGPLLGRDRPVSEQAHAWNGRVRDPVVLDALAARFGEDHVWSASRLERYARRPFDFFVSDVLRIERREEAGVETAPLAAGRVSHAVLEVLHDRLLAASPEALAAGIAHFDEVCDGVFGALEADADLWLGIPSIWALKRRVVRQALAEFVAWDLEALDRLGARPIATEVSFGDGGVEAVRLEGLDTAGRPAALLLAGRIDRVDRFREPTGGVRIVDYKWKGIPSRHGFDDGAVLQPALYLKAWEALHDETGREALFLSISKPGRGSRSGLTSDRADEVLSRALSIPARIRAGLFAPVQAASCHPPADSQPGPELVRTDVVIGAGSRFDHPVERS